MPIEMEWDSDEEEERDEARARAAARSQGGGSSSSSSSSSSSNTWGLALPQNTTIVTGASLTSKFSASAAAAAAAPARSAKICMELDSDEEDELRVAKGDPPLKPVVATQRSRLTFGDMMVPDKPDRDLLSILANAEVQRGPGGSAASKSPATDDDDMIDDAVEVQIDSSEFLQKYVVGSKAPARAGAAAGGGSKKRSHDSSLAPTSPAPKGGAATSSSSMGSSSDRFYQDLPKHVDEDSKQRPFEPLVLPAMYGRPQRQVPPSAAQFLLPHQVDGVHWLWEKYCVKQGAILGDDMGMGKTIQTIALFLALFEKTGTYEDEKRNRERARRVRAGDDLGDWFHKPCLVMCPKGIKEHWCQELGKWGYFTIDTDLSEGGGLQARLKSGMCEVVVASYSSLMRASGMLSAIDWGVIIYDEAHAHLMNRKTKTYQEAMKLNKADVRFLLTGTPVQNKLEEFWCLMWILSAETFHSLDIYKSDYIEPIKKGESTAATQTEREKAVECREEHKRLVLDRYYLSRRKTMLTGKNKLQKKEEIIVLCTATKLQKDLYRHVLSLPDFDNCRCYEEECPCGGRPGEKRKFCCDDMYCIPFIRPGPDQPLVSKIDPRAVQWKQLHFDGMACPKCPTCISLGCLDRLRKIVMHPSLLQVPRVQHDERRPDTEANLAEFTQNALSPELLEALGGYERPTNLSEVSRSLRQSGKMVYLEQMLESFNAGGDKTLVFSHSTKMLDLISTLCKVRGWEALRLDGKTQNRQAVVDEFQSASCIKKILLMTSKAGGVGLTLTAASKVIIYDQAWNPSTDQQSQDRAYRIGQTKEVQVYRLVTEGTLEELIYMRQLYKVNIQNAILQDEGEEEAGDQQQGSDKGKKKGAHRFEGIMGEKSRQGELFGLYNLMQFEDCSILNRLRHNQGGEDKDDHAAAVDESPAKKIKAPRFGVVESEVVKVVRNAHNINDPLINKITKEPTSEEAKAAALEAKAAAAAAAATVSSSSSSSSSSSGAAAAVANVVVPPVPRRNKGPMSASSHILQAAPAALAVPLPTAATGGAEANPDPSLFSPAFAQPAAIVGAAPAAGPPRRALPSSFMHKAGGAKALANG